MPCLLSRALTSILARDDLPVFLLPQTRTHSVSAGESGELSLRSLTKRCHWPGGCHVAAAGACASRSVLPAESRA